MAHHKRGRPRNGSKWYKANAMQGTFGALPISAQLARFAEADARADFVDDSVDDAELARALSWRRPPRLENDRAMRAKFRRRLAEGDLRAEL